MKRAWGPEGSVSCETWLFILARQSNAPSHLKQASSRGTTPKLQSFSFPKVRMWARRRLHRAHNFLYSGGPPSGSHPPP